MGDEGTFATTAEIQYKAGANASETSKAEGYCNVYIKQAESFINVFTGYNWTDTYASLNADVKEILKEAASNLAAIYVIQYDMSGFTSRTEAEDMINVLRDAALRGLAVLKSKARQDFIKNA